MENRIRKVGYLVAAVLIAVLALIGYFGWVNIANVDTLHAHIASDLAQIRAPVAGKVGACTLEIGDAVARDDELTTIESASLSTQIGSKVIVPIRSPLDGIVAARAVQPGDGVSMGQNLMTVVDPSELWITAMVHESRIPQVRIGQRVRIRVRSRTWRRRFWGRVEQIGVATTAAVTGQDPGGAVVRPEIPIKVSFDPMGYQLYPGMTVDVRIRLDPRQW
jgi:multidrug resistance efflux pump